MDDATRNQVRAALPDMSTWLAANAGSGKTRVLTDRVARLLLGGVEPQHILCLTYTKAAASEMQNRLFRRLGEWAMKPAAELQADLLHLGESAASLTPGRLARARQLFARAIETPGGLRIQTIHSFCATLLRRFPLEAGVSPRFSELDDRTARLMCDAIVEEITETHDPALMADVARLWTGEDFDSLAQQVAASRGSFNPPLDRDGAWALFGLTPGFSGQDVVDRVFLGVSAAWWAKVVATIAKGSARDVEMAAKMASVDVENPKLADVSRLEDAFLYATGARQHMAATDARPTKGTRTALGTDLAPLQDVMDRVAEQRPLRLALHAAERAHVLHRFAGRFLSLYGAAKDARGWLDFDDLITKASDLLNNPSVAAWVLFRLDGGIDHILVDEAQDTSPAQWRVIESLAAEFTAGRSARDENRTLFVVGDKKQSIYSFQGADVSAFDAKRAVFADRFTAAQRPFQTMELQHSFRSSPAVLGVVDQTFGDRYGRAMGETVTHLAHKGQMPGRVDLWPLIEKSDPADKGDWQDPVDLVADSHHAVRLAEKIAEFIARQLEQGTQIPTDKGPRPVHPGDFLVLVQRRSALFAEVIRACKAANLPIAGADRLKLGAELAVKDLAALLAFLATPEDDLALAAVLRSPLCGWSEDALFRLAQPRMGYLWPALVQAADRHPATHAMLTDLRDQADYLRPFDLIERALTRHDGRRRLLARLGPEAEDGIDEMLAQAIAYETVEVPSLTGFLVWMQTDEVVVKRQMDSEGRRIRVMTVHGAKGLEAPIVILPDMADQNPPDRDEVYSLNGQGIWKTPADASPPAVTALRADRKQRTDDENLRLLYVAMTRAQSWLVLCGAGDVKKDGTWYRLAEQALSQMATSPLPDGGLRHSLGDWPAPAQASAPPVQTVTLPDWAKTPAPDAPRPAALITPSGLGGAKALGGVGQESDAAMAAGTRVHRLLELLPTAPAHRHADLARAVGAALDELATAQRVITAHPHLFGPDSLAEVAITAPLPMGRLQGIVDRLVVAPDHVLAVDFKTNATLPPTPDATPDGILRQMGAYHAALLQIWPDRRIEMAILWTKTAELMRLPTEILVAALARATTP